MPELEESVYNAYERRRTQEDSFENSNTTNTTVNLINSTVSNSTNLTNTTINYTTPATATECEWWLYPSNQTYQRILTIEPTNCTYYLDCPECGSLNGSGNISTYSYLDQLCLQPQPSNETLLNTS